MNALGLMLHDMRREWSWHAAVAPHGRVVELPGATAFVVPAVPERSMMNGVVYDGADALERALPELARVFANAGVRAWTVWVPESDERARELLAVAGHRLDARPVGMALELASFEPIDPGDLDWSRTRAAADVTTVNDAAYPFDGTPFADAMAELGDAHAYVARVDGEVASCACVVDGDGTATVAMVATLPEARGLGLSTRLLAVALAEARERGLVRSSLVATSAGQPVYERLGYEIVTGFEMWERRSA